MAECPRHPGAESIGACTRCGRFYCAGERVEFDGQPYCGDCGARDDVDWLGHHYRRLEGTRSGVAWFLMFLGVGLGLIGLTLVAGPDLRWQERTLGLGFLVYGLAALGVFSGRWRPALVVGSLVSGALFTLGVKDLWGALVTLPMLGLAAAAWTDVRTRLFYRVPVPRIELARHYHREGSNPLAVHASRVALLSLFIPGLSLLSLAMGVLALTRIDAKAVPPVGNLSAALAALFFSLLTSLLWGVALAARL